MSISTAAKKPPAAERFKLMATEFGGVFVGMIDRQARAGKTIITGEMAKMGVDYSLEMPASDLVVRFLEKTYSHWMNIGRREELFFKNNFTRFIFDLPEGIGAVVVKPLLDNLASTEVETVWEYMETFVRMSMNHIIERRGGIKSRDYNARGDLVKLYYNKPDQMPNVVCYGQVYELDLEPYVKMFGLNI